MTNYDIKLNLGNVNISALQTEADLRREANQLLPQVLVQVGEALGEKAWEAMQKGLRGPHIKLNASPTEKRKFVREAGQNFQRKADSREQREVEDHIVQQLRKHMNAAK